MTRILVWDWPVRIGHWLMVGSFIIAWLTSESESLRLIHAFAGGTLVGVALFRLPWGFIGSRYARFRDFVRPLPAVLDYLRSLLTRSPRHHVGHNPAGGWAIVALLGLGLLTGASGWLIYNDLGGHWVEELHEAIASTMLTVVLIHVAGVIASSLLHRENLVRAMLHGHKQGEEADAIPSARPIFAFILLFWTLFASWVITTL